MADDSLLPTGIRGIGPRLKAARDRLARLEGARRMSQAQVGELVGVSGGQIGHWETGHQRPDVEMLERLARVLRVSAAWLYPGVGPLAKEGPPETDEEFMRRTGIAPRPRGNARDLIKPTKKAAQKKSGRRAGGTRGG